MPSATSPNSKTDHAITSNKENHGNRDQTDASFTKDVLESDVPVLVDFWAEWCGPCRMVAPILSEIAAENEGKIKVVKLNVDENPQTAAQYGVISIPTLNVYKGGQVVKQVVGAKPKQALLADLAEFL